MSGVPAFRFCSVSWSPLLPEHGNRARIAFACLLAAALADVGAGIWLRSVESLRNRGTQQLLANYRRYRDQRLVPGAAKLVPNAVVAGDTPFIDYAGILENLRPLDNYWVFLSPYISDAEWDQRKALNSYLCDPAASESSLRESLSGVNWTPNRIDDEQRRITKRLAIFRTLGPDLDATLDLYKVHTSRWRPIRSHRPTWAGGGPASKAGLTGNSGSVGRSHAIRPPRRSSRGRSRNDSLV